MIRKDLINCIYDDVNIRSCPTQYCDKPEEEDNTGKCCLKCAEEQLLEYEQKIRQDFAEELKRNISVQVFELDDKTICKLIDKTLEKFERIGKNE